MFSLFSCLAWLFQQQIELLLAMKKGQVANFIEKLDQILETPQYSGIICWTPEGDAFTIKSVTKLTDVVLPKYFKHQNYSSFNRQLNMYNFVKVRCETDEIVYKNPHFLRYDKQQYKCIKRRSKLEECEENGALASCNQPQSILQELKQIGRRQYRLENVCKDIFNENQTIINENAKLWKKISQKLNRKNKQLSALLYLLLLGTDSKQLLHNWSLIQAHEPVDSASENSSSGSQEQDNVVQHSDFPRDSTKQLMSLLSKKNPNIQELLRYLSEERLKQQQESNPAMDQNQTNLCLKEHGQSSKQSSTSQKQPSEKDTQRQKSIISDVNYFLNNDADEVQDLSEFGIYSD